MEKFHAELQATVSALFRRYPELYGFTVQDFEGRLVLAHMGVDPLFGDGASERLRGDVAEALLQFIDERPEALELLRDRTFARVLH
ncbi:MAG: hypothetical protein A3G81_21585 [Betaproteobacteria bacterium RIFCSPLOWO2_12_FULL_65_14]|nr:MAG: hypothetical protein A3G81_21585 [Betaproteobacteria bacterium RIFCSPLOWO2_12_FULL_65_14]